MTVKLVPAVTSALVMVVGGLVLIGWIADIGILKSVAPQWATMKFNTSACFLLAGISLWLLRTVNASFRAKLIGRFFAGAVLLTALLTLAEEALRMDFGIDQFFFHEGVNAVQTPHPGRMSLGAALSFALIGIALLSLDWKTQGGRRPASVCGVLVGVIGLLAFAGYLYGVKSLYSAAPFSSMAVHTGFCFMALSAGLLCARTGSGALEILTSDQVGGNLLRRMLPFAIAVPLLVGWLRLQGERAGLYGFEFGLALFAVSNVMIFAVLLWMTAARLNRTDAAVRESDRRHLELIESLPQLVWTCQAEGPCDYLSPQWVTYTGIPEQQQLGYGWLERIHPDDRDRTIGRWKETAGVGLPLDIEFRICRHDGVYRWFKTRAEPLRDPTGRIVKWFGTNTDIDDRFQAEQAFAREAARRKLLLDNAEDGIFILNHHFAVIESNMSFAEMLGCSIAETLQLSPWDWDVVYPTKEIWLATWPELPSARLKFESRIRHKNGNIFNVEISGSPVVAESSESRLMLFICHDMTQRKRAEELLRASEQRYRLLADALPQIVWTAKPDGNLAYYNQRWFEYTGMTLEQTKDWGWQPVLHPDDLQNCIDRWTSVLKTEGAYEIEYRFKRAIDGAYRWHLGRAFPLRAANGEIIEWIGTCTDIDDQKREEENLRQSALNLERLIADRTAELHRSNRDLEQFAYVASHDLQEPLRAVTGCGQILKSRYGGKLDGSADELIEHIVEGASRMQTLILDLLAYSRVGTQQKECAEVDSAAALQQALANLETATKENGATVTVGQLPTVRFDAVQLTQVFQNLLANALKYRSSRSPEIRVEAIRKTEEWQFSVIDNGIGIEPKYFERVFVLFQRLHTRSEYPGTGIGLALCKKIVERHGGRIWVESTFGAGSVFCFTIPFKD